MVEIIIGKNEAGQRFDKFIFKYLKEAPSSFVYKMLRKKNIVLNGKKSEGKEMLALGDSVKFFLADDTIAKFRGLNSADSQDTSPKYPTTKLDIVFENDDIIVANKPSGMLSQKAEEKDISINEYLLGYLYEKGEVTNLSLQTFVPSVCNRLDRNTSGLILFGKTLSGTQMLNRVLKDRSIKKYYLAVVSGRLTKDETIEGYLIKDEKSNKVKIVKAKSEDDEKYIKTSYKVLKSTDDFSILFVHLHTGRSHQIRAHLSSIGHPIIGDSKYGKQEINKKFHEKSQLLHSYMVSFPDGQTYVAKPPANYSKYIESGNSICLPLTPED